MRQDTPDRELLGAYLGGDEEAFAALVRRHGPAVRATCRRVLGRVAEVDDATQSALVVLARRAAEARTHPALGAWLHRVAWHAAMGARKRARLRAAREREAGALAPAAAVEPAQPELADALEAALDALPEKYRTAVVLHHLHGQAEAEIARRLGCSESAVSMRLTRARRKLRERLGTLGVASEAALVSGALRIAPQPVDAPALARAALAEIRAAATAPPLRARPSRWCAAAASVAVLALASSIDRGVPTSVPSSGPPAAHTSAPASPAPITLPSRASREPLAALPAPRPFDASRALAGGLSTYARTVLRQRDGKLIMVGGSDPEVAVVLARYLPDGTLDPAFGQGGIARADGFSVDDDSTRQWGVMPRAAAMDEDGGITVGVVMHPMPLRYDRGFGCGVMHFRADGTPDGRFGTGRNGRMAFPTQLLTCVPCDAGRLLFAGQIPHADGTAEMPVVRLLPDGRPDPTFGRDGVVRLPLPGAHGGLVRAAAARPDGGVVALLASGTPGSDEHDLLVRITPEGALDPTFGSGGLAWTGGDFGYINYELCDTHSLALQDDGGIVIAGNHGTHKNGCVCSVDAQVMRFAADGSRDESFADHGTATLMLGEVNYMDPFMIAAVAALPDGRVVVGGAGRIAPHVWRPTLACLTRDGAFDTSVGDGGVITAEVGSEAHVHSVLAVDGGLAVSVDVADPADTTHADMALLRVSTGDLPPAPTRANN